MDKTFLHWRFISSLFIFTLFAQVNAADILSGRVYEGDKGTEPPTSRALSSVTVKLYGSNNSDNLGSQIGSTTTNSHGWYGLTATVGYEFYTILETDPSSYYSVGATSVDGTVINDNQIRYSVISGPLSDQTLTGNKFWDKPDTPANNPPVADANGPYTGTVGQSITLDGSGSSDPDAGDSIVSYEWDLDNDGQYDDAMGVNPSWIWNSPTTIIIRLKVTDSFGATDTDGSTVTINDQPQPCEAAFDADPREGCAPLTVNFTDKSQNARSWIWTFPGGNPGTSTLQNPGVIYQNPGTYSVALKITCENGVVDSTIKLDYITVRNCNPEMDFGDAPRGYPTILGDNGARHIIDPDVYLGAQIDSETDGQPNSDASGDDNDGTDDDDGVVIKTSLKTGSGTNVEVTASTEGFLNAWVDFNQNNNWGESDEHIFINQPLNAGLNNITLNVPSNASTGATFARFRFSRSQGLSYDGEADDGEVEDYLVEIDEGAQSGNITIIKAATPLDNSVVFNFVGDLGNFSLSPASNKKEFKNLPAGNYTITENIPSGWFLGNYQIAGDLDGGTTHDSLAARYSIDLDAGEDISIVIYNYKAGTIIIEKQTIPDNSPDMFNFTGAITGSVGDGAQISYSAFQPGAYKIQEIVPSGWKLIDIQFSDQNSSGDLQTATATIFLEAGETVKVVFTNEKEGADQMDFGDAPDPTYPTLMASNGARHIIDPDVYLGSQIDSEPDGQPNSDASGDDSDGTDDDDGVVIKTSLKTGSGTNVEVTASTEGFLNAWVDFNRNNNWGETNEHVFINQPLNAGLNNLTLNVPSNARTGATFARFRFSRSQDLSYEGEADDGEVEDYLVEIDDGLGDANVGDRVWNDLNKNGLQDSGEPGLDGVTVSLYDSNGNLLASTLTSSGGQYLFSNVNPGNYFINFTLLSGFSFSPPDIGPDDTIDSDAQYGTGNTSVFILSAGDNNLDMDAGIYRQDEPDNYDFGDAPDSPEGPGYPTLLANNGARHLIQSDGPWLGGPNDYPDVETNGQQSANADGDDNDGNDDENGFNVVPVMPMVPGSQYEVIVRYTTADTAYLNMWVDFNGNGNWADANEHALIDVSVYGPFTMLNSFINIPASAKPGKTFARFRISSQNGLSSTGMAADGEVEDYQVVIQPDGPDPGAKVDTFGVCLKMKVDINGIGLTNVQISGPVIQKTYYEVGTPGTANDDDLNGLDDVVTRLVDMRLTATDPIVGQVILRLHPTIPSFGQVEETVNNTPGILDIKPFTPTGLANSFFDTFLAIELPDLGICLYPNKPIRLAGQIDQIPPSSMNTYAAAISSPAPLYKMPCGSNPGTVPVPPPAPDASIISILSCDQGTDDELDFGDAPDPTYPTLLASNGARHVINQSFYLGSGIDAEPDGQPTALSDGDNNTNTNDEDGVTMSPFIAPGQSVPITIVASDAGVINAWIDFNIDGDWADAGEHFIAAQPVISGANSLTFNVPMGAVSGLSYARFRFSSIRNLSYDGLAPDGEVEDYVVEITEPQDGSIIVIKDATPKDNTQFLICQQLSGSFFSMLCGFLQDPLNNKMTILNPGDVISISEAVIPGWLLQDITITGDIDNGSTVNVASGRVDLDHDPGENIVITFKNIKSGDDELFDLGDAPDGTNHSGLSMNAYPGIPANFPTVFDPATGIPQGPRHANTKADARLGTNSSGEFEADLIPDNDGLTNLDPPNDAADRDNFDDGVKIPFPLPSCQQSYFTYTVSVPPGSVGKDRYVNVWFDWNRDGDWADTFTCKSPSDAPEWAVQNQLIPGGFPPGEYLFATPLFTVHHPTGFETNPIWMRISIAESIAPSEGDGRGPANGYQYGETEDYYFAPKDTTEGGQFDFGDAPDPTYPTLLASNGARHVITPNLYLGTGIDPESEGQPTGMADGDDKNIVFPGTPYPSGDEDGVQIPTIFTPGTSIPINVFASAPGVLNAWLDFNINGSWADAGEHIVAAQPLVAGINNFTINVPASAQTGQSYARFRLSSVRNISYNGPAPDGEVEDYAVVIQKGDGGDLTIIKDATPKDNTPFWISVVYGIMGGAAPYRDPMSNMSSITNAPAGTYHVGESVPIGWALTDIVVTGDTDNGSGIDVGNGIVDVDLDAGESITVVFKNNKTGEDDLYDFGDAPTNYFQSLFATLNPNVKMGQEIDAEPAAQPDAHALGDDNNGIDDEDGVAFLTPMQPGQTASVEIDLTGTVSNYSPRLWAYIDFNNNGNWSDFGEQVINQNVTAGVKQTFSISVPPSAKLGTTFARFHLVDTGPVPPNGTPYGEVEDYEVFIGEGGEESPIKWMQIPLLNEDPDMPYTPYFFGWDVKSVYDGTFVADDWFCKSPRPVTEIHWWGSYTEWDSIVAPPIAPHAFHIGIWTDVPAGIDKDWSHPGTMEKEWIVPREILGEHVVGDDFHPEYMTKPDTCFQYHFIIPQDEWFYQEGDSTVYWLSIAALYEEEPDQFVWGWKTREHFFQDDAVYVYEPNQPTIGDVAIESEPIDHGWDMAFTLMTDEYFFESDFGDAPAERYPTFFGQNGPLHYINPLVHLGERLDAEFDAQPDHTATGDDNDGSDDDDGIEFIAPTGDNPEAFIKVAASLPGYLNAWMDFNNNGSWADSDEHIFRDIFLPGGLSTLPFTIPDDAVNHEIFSRFRFCTQPGLTYVGIAIDGEVEDYYVNLTETDVKDITPEETVPESFGLHQNYPNPFNPQTTIEFDLPKNADISIKVYNYNGQLVRTLVSGPFHAGVHNITWDAMDNNGHKVTSGLYFVILKAGSDVSRIKLLLTK